MRCLHAQAEGFQDEVLMAMCHVPDAVPNTTEGPALSTIPPAGTRSGANTVSLSREELLRFTEVEAPFLGLTATKLKKIKDGAHLQEQRSSATGSSGKKQKMGKVTKFDQGNQGQSEWATAIPWQPLRCWRWAKPLIQSCNPRGVQAVPGQRH